MKKDLQRKLSLEIEGRRLSQIKNWYRLRDGRELSKETIKPAYGFVQAVRHAGPDSLADKLYNANPCPCNQCEGFGCKYCEGFGTIYAQWELKSKALEYAEFDELTKTLCNELQPPQHIHISFVPPSDKRELQALTARCGNWVLQTSLRYCLRALAAGSITTLKPIFKVLTQRDVARWQHGLRTNSPVDIKSRNLAFRSFAPYKQIKGSVGFEFRIGHQPQDVQALYELLAEAKNVPALAVAPVPVVDSDLDPKLKRILIGRLSGDTRWVLPLMHWERDPLFAHKASVIREARAQFVDMLSSKLPNEFAFMGVQFNDNVPLALQVNTWFPEALANWAKQVSLHQDL